MTPVTGFRLSPAGNPLALNVTGLLLATMGVSKNRPLFPGGIGLAG